MFRTLFLAAVAAAAFAAVPLVLAPEPQGNDAGETGTASVPPRRAPAPSGRKVLLAAGESGHFSAEFRLNGRAVRAMIDTDATVIALNLSTARRIGINPPESAFTGRARTANGLVRAAPVVIDRVSLGRIGLRDVEAVVLDDRALSTALVGMSFLSRLKRYSVTGATLALEQ